jgi:hypothetical protein
MNTIAASSKSRGYITPEDVQAAIDAHHGDIDALEVLGLCAFVAFRGAPTARRIPTRIYRNEEGRICSTCDGTHAHVHGYDEHGEVPGMFDGSDWA